MAEYLKIRLDDLFHALADATRRAMLAALVDGERSVGELAAPFEMSLAAASKHIKTLERAGLVRRDIRGRTHVCALDPAPLADANAWLQRYAAFWSERLDALELTLHEEEERDHASRDGAVDAAHDAIHDPNQETPHNFAQPPEHDPTHDRD